MMKPYYIIEMMSSDNLARKKGKKKFWCFRDNNILFSVNHIRFEGKTPFAVGLSATDG
jgi:hypothetical protein